MVKVFTQSGTSLCFQSHASLVFWFAPPSYNFFLKAWWMLKIVFLNSLDLHFVLFRGDFVCPSVQAAVFIRIMILFCRTAGYIFTLVEHFICVDNLCCISSAYSFTISLFPHPSTNDCMLLFLNFFWLIFIHSHLVELGSVVLEISFDVSVRNFGYSLVRL
jgi:hypothetical protein